MPSRGMAALRGTKARPATLRETEGYKGGEEREDERERDKEIADLTWEESHHDTKHHEIGHSRSSCLPHYNKQVAGACREPTNRVQKDVASKRPNAPKSPTQKGHSVALHKPHGSTDILPTLLA